MFLHRLGTSSALPFYSLFLLYLCFYTCALCNLTCIYRYSILLCFYSFRYYMSFNNFLYGVKSIVGSRKSRVALDKWFETTTVGIYA
jgi:hypothetical protein